MRKARFSETQIVEILKHAESGVPVADLLRKHGISKAHVLQVPKVRWRVGLRRQAPPGVRGGERKVEANLRRPRA